MAIDLHDTSGVKKLHVPSLQEAERVIGETLVTPWFQMDPERSAEFEHSTYLNEYPNPYEEDAGEGYGEGLVEGYHLLGMIDYLMNHVVESPTDIRIIPWNYGLDHVRFVSVVRTTDRFRLHGTLSKVEARDTGLLATFDLKAEVEGREKPAFVAVQHALWVVMDAHQGAEER